MDFKMCASIYGKFYQYFFFIIMVYFRYREKKYSLIVLIIVYIKKGRCPNALNCIFRLQFLFHCNQSCEYTISILI